MRELCVMLIVTSLTIITTVHLKKLPNKFVPVLEISSVILSSSSDVKAVIVASFFSHVPSLLATHGTHSPSEKRDVRPQLDGWPSFQRDAGPVCVHVCV